MTTVKQPNRKTAKVRFFVFYTISILLVLILFASFSKGRATGNETATETGDRFGTRISVDELLHQRLERLDDVRAQYAGKDTKEAAAAIQSEKAAFQLTIDSIRKASASLTDDAEKSKIENLVASFSHNAESNVTVLKNGVVASGADTANSAALEELKDILVQKEQRITELEKAGQNAGGAAAALQDKDKTIAALQSRVTTLEATLAQQPKGSQTANRSDGGEWKDRYQKLKEVSDRNVSEANAIKASYKEVLEDNKRLASQIQALKTGRNQ